MMGASDSELDENIGLKVLVFDYSWDKSASLDSNIETAIGIGERIVWDDDDWEGYSCGYGDYRLLFDFDEKRLYLQDELQEEVEELNQILNPLIVSVLGLILLF